MVFLMALLYPRQPVAEGIMFFTCPSANPVFWVVFFCKHNSSETAQQNFLKLCYCENVQMLFFFF